MFIMSRLPKIWLYEKALSIDPINAHLLELLNMALESSTVPVPNTGKGLSVGEESKSVLLSSRAKYEQLDEPCEEQSNEMYVG